MKDPTGTNIIKWWTSVVTPVKPIYTGLVQDCCCCPVQK